MDLFTAQVVRKEASLDELMAGSIASIKQLFDHGHPVLVAFSSGKDSSALMMLTFMAGIQAKQEGRNPRIAVCHSNTGADSILHDQAVQRHDLAD